MNSHYKHEVIILGAGLAGLACADELLQRSKEKLKVLVLEKNPYIGGLAATFKRDGFLFDLAPHRWFTKNNELNSWLNELMGKEMIWVEKNTPMYQFGKFFKYPIDIFDVLKKIDLIKISAMLLSFIWARMTHKIFKKKIVTMKDAYINRFGYALYKWFNEEYNIKLWGKNFAEEMSGDWVEQRTKDLSMITMIKESFGFEKKVISLTPRFLFPAKGIGRISENLELRINKNGGCVLKNVFIKKIIKIKTGFQIESNRGSFLSSHLISSIPIDVLVELIAPSPPPKILKTAKKLDYISQKIVVLLVNKPHLTPFTWVYIHPPEIAAFRFLETNNWSNQMSPKGKNSLVFEYPYHPGDKVEKMSDRELIDLSVKDFITHFAPSTKKTDFFKGYVFLVPKTYPKYDLDYEKKTSLIKSYLRKNFENLQLIGRSGMFRYNNMDHSIYTGLLAARNILAGKFIYDLENVNNEAAYIEEKEIE